jgi:hypothetical protein
LITIVLWYFSFFLALRSFFYFYFDVYNEDWNSVVDLDDLNAFGSIIEMSMHGFGGGSARFSELAKPTMLHVIWYNNTVYYKMESTKQFNHLSKRQKIIERKLPVAVARYYLLFCSLVRKEAEKYQNSLFMIPKLKDFKDSQYTVRHVICDIFSLGSLPNMTKSDISGQVLHILFPTTGIWID